MGVILTHFITSGGTAHQGTTRDLFYMVLAANWHLQENLIMTELEEVVHFNFENVMKEHKKLSINSEIFLKKIKALREGWTLQKLSKSWYCQEGYSKKRIEN